MCSSSATFKSTAARPHSVSKSTTPKAYVSAFIVSLRVRKKKTIVCRPPKFVELVGECPAGHIVVHKDHLPIRVPKLGERLDLHKKLAGPLRGTLPNPPLPIRSPSLKFPVADWISTNEKRRQRRSALADGLFFSSGASRQGVWAGKTIVRVAQLEYFECRNELKPVHELIVRMQRNREITFALLFAPSNCHQVVLIIPGNVFTFTG
ncbi:50S ribosomal protein L18P [Striga asiatica]|uniref:50S ribosomal protein L18P n=1 Tax=Striga asiatica TaxID=4170 RepID=A0A5A7QIU3_STRAF|nr:50S ribosomal protein L18P [Striga asiatica]